MRITGRGWSGFGGRSVAVAVGVLVTGLVVTGCFGGGGGVDRPSEPSFQEHGTGEAISITLRTQTGDRIRTRKLLSVTEILPRGDQATSTVDESFVQETIHADSQGQAVQVLRRWERFLTRVERPGAEVVEQTGTLEGSEVELTRRVSGVTARVVSGAADAGQLNGMVITSMEGALLPNRAVRVGDRWMIDAGAKGEFAGVFKALGLTPTKSEQRCALVAIVRPSADGAAGEDGASVEENGAVVESANRTARISIDWQITGTMAGTGAGSNTPMVMRLSGEMRVDLELGLVTRLELGGGRQNPDGTVRRQISILIEREMVQGWWR